MALQDYFVNIPKKQLLLLAVLALGAVGFGYYSLLLKPAFAEKAKLQEELQSLQVQLAQKRRLSSRKPALEWEIKDLEAKLEAVKAQLPTDKEIPSLLTQVNTQGRQAGLDFLLFKPGKGVNRGFYTEIPIELRVEGTYHALGVFFDRVSKMPRIVNVSDLKIEGLGGKKGPQATLTAEFTATTYTFTGGSGSGTQGGT